MAEDHPTGRGVTRRDGSADEPADQLVEAGSALAGALAGGAIGTIGGPPGVILGAVLGVAVQQASRVVMSRLSSREEERVGATLIFMEQDATERADRGERVRTDGFFEASWSGRSLGDEVLEAVMRQAAETFEEEKLPYLARLYSAVAHDPSVSGREAHILVTLAGDLSLGQLSLLGAIQSQDFGQPGNQDRTGRELYGVSVGYELDDLGDRRLLARIQDGELRSLGAAFIGGEITASELPLATLRLAPIGERLVVMAGLTDLA